MGTNVNDLPKYNNCYVTLYAYLLIRLHPTSRTRQFIADIRLNMDKRLVKHSLYLHIATLN